jgi:hypothetical protein
MKEKVLRCVSRYLGFCIAVLRRSIENLSGEPQCQLDLNLPYGKKMVTGSHIWF